MAKNDVDRGLESRRPTTVALEARYPYRPFMETRLLIVHPAPFDEKTIRCDLVHISLSNVPPPTYETISYCWGDHTRKSTVNIDGRDVWVPSSSAIAIRHMRYPDKSRFLWIDAICINQQDLDERTQQMTLMGKIFRNSMQNLVFLGEEDQFARPAIRSIGNILNAARQDTGNLTELWSVVYDHHLRDWAYSSTELRADIDVEALTTFLSKPWFSRLWVIQETALAAKNLCIYGSHIVPLVDIVRAGIWLQHKAVKLPRKLIDTPGVLQASNLYSLVDEQNGPNYRVLRYGLSDFLLFKMQQAFFASDPRDRVYSLNELRKPVRPDYPEGSPSPREQAYRLLEASRPSEIFRLTLPEIVADYTKSPAEVFLYATKRAIKEGADSPDMLRFVNHDIDVVLGQDRPSWVPEWNHHTALSPRPVLLSQAFLAHDLNLQPEATLQPSDFELPVLSVRGFRLAQIQTIVPALVNTSSSTTDLPASSYIQWLAEVEKVADTAGMDTTDVGLTLLGGFDRDKQRAGAADAAARALLIEYLKKHDRQPPAPENLPDESLESETLQAARYFEQFSQVCCYRSFFITKDGCCGLGPQTVRPEDHLVIFYGARVPFALRQRQLEEGFHLLGECYVHGVMYGEATRAHRAQDTPDEDFCLW